MKAKITSLQLEHHRNCGTVVTVARIGQEQSVASDWKVRYNVTPSSAIRVFRSIMRLEEIRLQKSGN